MSRQHEVMERMRSVWDTVTPFLMPPAELAEWEAVQQEDAEAEAAAAAAAASSGPPSRSAPAPPLPPTHTCVTELSQRLRAASGSAPLSPNSKRLSGFLPRVEAASPAAAASSSTTTTTTITPDPKPTNAEPPPEDVAPPMTRRRAAPIPPRLLSKASPLSASMQFEIPTLNRSGRSMTELGDDILMRTFLTSLNVSRNNLSNLPGELSALSSLTSLDVSHNRMRGWPLVVGSLQRLKTLDVQGNPLGAHRHDDSDAKGDDTWSLPASLTQLHINGCALSTLPHPDGSVWDLPHLQVVRASHNALSKLPPSGAPWNRWHGLRELRLSHNCLVELPEAALSSAAGALEVLDVSHNALAALPSGINALTQLRFLHAAHNALAGELDVTGCTGLHTLELHHNHVAALREPVPQSLTSLHASANELTQVPVSVWTCTGLQELRLAGNRIGPHLVAPEHVDALTDVSLEQLRILNLAHNRLEGALGAEVPDLWPTAAALETLNVYGNQLTDVTPVMQPLAVGLISVHLGYNKIESADAWAPCLMEAPDLEEMWLGPNPPALGAQLCTLWSRPSPEWSILRRIHMPGMGLERIPATVLSVRELEHLDVSRNRLAALPDELGSMPWLQSVDVSHNQLSGALPRDLDDAQGLKVLDMSHNPLQQAALWSGPDHDGPLERLLERGVIVALDGASRDLRLPPTYGTRRDVLNQDGSSSVTRTQAVQSSDVLCITLDMGNTAPHAVAAMETEAPDAMAAASAHLGLAEMLGRRPTMEDAWSVWPSFGGHADHTLLTMFDGHASRDIAAAGALLVPAYLGRALAAKVEAVHAEEVAKSVESVEAVSDVAESGDGDAATPSDDAAEASQAKDDDDGDEAVSGAEAKPGCGEAGRSRALTLVADEVTEELWRQVFHQANGHMQSDPESMDISPSSRHSGATAVVVLVTSTCLWTANVGDSRAVLAVAADGDVEALTAHRLSYDHKPSNQDERSRIQLVGGYVQDGRINGTLAVSRAFGDYFLAPCVSCVPYVSHRKRNKEADRFLIVACDGVWDEVTDEEAVHLVARALKNGHDLDTAAAMLRDHAFALGSDDNISVMVYSFGDDV